MRWLWPAAKTADDLWDYEHWDTLTARHVQVAREQGDLTGLHLVLTSRLALHLFAGEYSTASSLLAEIQTVADATGIGLAPYGTISLAVLHGDADEGRAPCRNPYR